MPGQPVSVSPGALLVQVPSDAVSAQDLQTPVQLVRQQTPCSQKPFRHSWAPKQVAPGGLSPHVPLTHVAGDLQCMSAVQDALHAFVSHRNGKQSDAAGVTHAPAPLHVDSAVNWSVVAAQLASRQGVPET